MGGQSRTHDQAVAALGSANAGVVTRTELLDAGISRGRSTSGSRKAHSCGSTPAYTERATAPRLAGRYLAAVRACGEGAILSGRAAAHPLGLLRKAPCEIEVTTSTERRVPGIRTRRRRALDEHHLTVELDSCRHHNSRHTWDQDRRREREAWARGEELRRFTHGDVFKRPAATIEEVSDLLRAAGVLDKPPRARPGQDI